MKFLCLSYYNKEDFSKLTKKDVLKLEQICAPHDEAIRGSGHLKLVGSIAPPEKAKTIRVEGAAAVTSVTDGPFVDSPNPLGAFFLIDAETADEAVNIASMHPGAHVGELFRGSIEVWPVEGFDEC